MLIVGIDLAWGERNGDGLCLLEATEDRTACRVLECAHVFGDQALFAWLEAKTTSAKTGALLLFDAPLICPNITGSRPVDRLTQSRFGRFHAGPHPANAARCQRPLRIAEALLTRGYSVGWEWRPGAKLMAEVFPHPALVRMLNLPRIVKYKRGPVAARRVEFQRLQTLLRQHIQTKLPGLAETAALTALFDSAWTKPNEDQLDAFICALIGLRHWRDGGQRSEVLGDLATGFILLPSAD